MNVNVMFGWIRISDEAGISLSLSIKNLRHWCRLCRFALARSAMVARGPRSHGKLILGTKPVTVVFLQPRFCNVTDLNKYLKSFLSLSISPLALYNISR